MSTNNQIKSTDMEIVRNLCFESTIKINFHTSEEALMVKSCLEVDEELQPSKIHRSISVTDSFLIM